MVIYGCGTFKFRDRSCNLVVVGSARFAHQAGTSNITPFMHYRCPKYVTHSIATVCALSTSLMWAFGRVRGLDGGVCVYPAAAAKGAVSVQIFPLRLLSARAYKAAPVFVQAALGVCPHLVYSINTTRR